MSRSAIDTIDIAAELGLVARAPAPAAVFAANDVRYALDPLRWAEEQVRLIHKGKSTAFVARAYQRDLLNDDSALRIVLKPRQVGVSSTLAIEAVHTAIFQRDVQILLVSRNLEAAKSVIRYCHQIVGNLLGEPLTRHASKTALELTNGSEIQSIAGHPDAARSFSPIAIVFDEAGFATDARAIWEALLGIQARLTVASTPNGRHNLFHDLWHSGGDWSRHFIHWSANPDFTDTWALEKQKLLTRTQWAQEFGCDFVASGESVFSDGDITRAGETHDATLRARAEEDRTIPVQIAWDIGRRSDHSVGVALASDDQEHWHVIDFDRFVRVPFPEIAARIATFAKRYPQAEVRVESNGIGDPLIEFLSIPVESFVTTQHSKTQALQSVQLLLEQGTLHLPIDEVEPLVTELRVYEWSDKNLRQDCVIALALAVDAVANAPGLGVW
jgi:hypothetical protein